MIPDLDRKIEGLLGETSSLKKILDNSIRGDPRENSGSLVVTCQRRAGGLQEGRGIVFTALLLTSPRRRELITVAVSID
jgi:hypothetical protein